VRRRVCEAGCEFGRQSGGEILGRNGGKWEMEK